MGSSERETPGSHVRVGRPRRSSPVMLEESAAELFLEQGYDGTTIDQISSRAGVARTTFFNYFPTKGDLLWVELDAAVPRLDDALAAVSAGSSGLGAVEEALAVVADDITGARVPWAVSQRELMGTADELRATGLARLLAVSEVLERHLRRTEPALGDAGARAASASIAAAAMAGASQWIEEGTARGPLADHLRGAVRPVVDGWRGRIGAID
ncbi:TetR family transcriptional regulator [Labedella endophytica]|uniref:TetR family transcriptional regulator n=1 Tax=Labedella endophytica TaxID=1523160 RepID=A0A433JNX1_9MICO|nr:TetR family transcriptional regulator [Labedella endophytica]RUQ97508.1 TetR family transcriptional regulator [Labedella endophytica]